MAPDTSVPVALADWTTVEKVQEGFALASKFGGDELMTCITVDANAKTLQPAVWRKPKGAFPNWTRAKPS